MALVELAERYAVGNGVPESYGKALSYVKRAQNAGVSDAMEQFSSDVENYRAAQQRDAEEKERQRQEAEAVKQREAEEKNSNVRRPKPKIKSVMMRFSRNCRNGKTNCKSCE